MGRTGLVALCATALSFGLCLPTSSDAQIIVSQPGEIIRHPEKRYGWCWVVVNHTDTYFSGIVFLPRDDFRERFLPAYQAHAEANIGHVRDTLCQDDFGSAYSAEEDFNRWITNNADTKWTKTGWTGGFPTSGPTETNSAGAVKKAPAPPARAARAAPPPPAAAPVQPAPDAEVQRTSQLNAGIQKHNDDVAAENRRRKEGYEATLAAKAAEVKQYEAELARANAAKAQYERDLAAHQATVRNQTTKKDREAMVDWREAVTVCELNQTNAQSKFGNWRCVGPLQYTYAKLGAGGAGLTPGALANVSDACGGKPESVRDLGMVGEYHVFGCSFGLHPAAGQGSSSFDAAAKFGLGFIEGRKTFRCPAWKSYCRTS
jgi:hypothetical protein